MKLPPSFYLRKNVVAISRELLGKYLFSKIDGVMAGGIITETEAYEGVTDRASHAYGGRRTARTEVMFGEGGTAYIYLCYGIHSLFNVVTNRRDIPHAVLVRSLYPTHAIETIKKRRGKNTSTEKLVIGPGTVTQALGLHFSLTGTSLSGDRVWMEDLGLKIPKSRIRVDKRIGVDYAGKDALLPYRFFIPHHELSPLLSEAVVREPSGRGR